MASTAKSALWLLFPWAAGDPRRLLPTSLAAQLADVPGVVKNRLRLLQVIARRLSEAAGANVPERRDQPVETIRTQNVQLCTAYAIINSAMPKPPTDATEVLPGVTASQCQLSELASRATRNRQASTEDSV